MRIVACFSPRQKTCSAYSSLSEWGFLELICLLNKNTIVLEAARMITVKSTYRNNGEFLNIILGEMAAIMAEVFLYPTRTSTLNFIHVSLLLIQT